MKMNLPELGKPALPTPHFPTRQQTFLFRAWELIPCEKIAALVGTTPEIIEQAALEMGLAPQPEEMLWLERGYITIIRQLWHVLPYSQLLELLGMDELEFAITLREDDFLDHKLGKKPICDPIVWRELTEEEHAKTEKIRQVMQTLEVSGVKPFDFHYDVQQLQFSGEEQFELRMVYLFSGLYQHTFDVDSRSYCPDSMLEAYQKVGINALWTQGVLYQLAEFPFDPAFSAGWQGRIAHLKDFADRCEKYGIKLYLYLNEPRCMPDTFFQKYPHLRGHVRDAEKICMCTSTPEVQNYIKDSVECICRNVPNIGGFFTITRSENLTNCFSHSTPEDCECPRCRNRSVAEVVSEVIGCIRTGADRVDSGIKVIAWDWAWKEFNLDIIRAMPKNVILQAQSELHVPFEIGGVKGDVVDYSMGIIGPGERALTEWAVARECGLELSAKVQINTTWEGSTVPALPVYPLVREHIRRLKEAGVTNLMLSWTLGGYPSRNIMQAAEFFYEKLENPEALQLTPQQQKAVELFSAAFQEFPFHIGVLYSGPQNAGPSTLMYLEPTGYHASMTCYAYDDLERWRAIYPEDIFLSQLDKLCDGWQAGLDCLEQDKSKWSELEVMAWSAASLFFSSRNLTRFYIARSKGDRQTMAQMAREEEKSARIMLDMMNRNAAIGYEAANHYYFSRGQLCEKILNCRQILRQLEMENDRADI